MDEGAPLAFGAPAVGHGLLGAVIEFYEVFPRQLWQLLGLGPDRAILSEAINKVNLRERALKAHCRQTESLQYRTKQLIDKRTQIRVSTGSPMKCLDLCHNLIQI